MSGLNTRCEGRNNYKEWVFKAEYLQNTVLCFYYGWLPQLFFGDGCFWSYNHGLSPVLAAYMQLTQLIVYFAWGQNDHHNKTQTEIK